MEKRGKFGGTAEAKKKKKGLYLFTDLFEALLLPSVAKEIKH